MLCFLDPSTYPTTLDEARDRSNLLVWSILAAGSQEIEELHELTSIAQENTIHLLRLSLGGRGVSYWDLCGAMVYNEYIAPIAPTGQPFLQLLRSQA